MTGPLILIAVIVVVVGGVLALAVVTGRRAKGDYVLLGTAAGEAEVHLWMDILKRVGLAARTRRIGDLLTGDMTTPGGMGAGGYGYELWVRATDEKKARKLLRL